MMNVMTPSLSTNHIRGSDLLRGGVMAQPQLAVCERFHAASRPARRGAKSPPACRSKVAGPFLFSRAGRLPLLKMRASKQAIVPCIMLPKALNFGWATLGMDRLLGSSSQRGSLGWHLRDWSPRLGIYASAHIQPS